MKQPTIEQRLMAAAPLVINRAFVSRTMEAVRHNALQTNIPAWKSWLSPLRPASALAIALVLLLAGGGVSYAVYELLIKPAQVTVTPGHATEDGHDRAVVQMTDCTGKADQSVDIESARGQSISPADARRVVMAACEKRAIEAYAEKTSQTLNARGDGYTYVLSVSDPIKMPASLGETWRLSDHPDSPTLPITDDVQFIGRDGMSTTASKLPAGSTVFAITSLRYKTDNPSASGSTSTLHAVIAVQFEPKDYAQAKAMFYATVPCENNTPGEQCFDETQQLYWANTYIVQSQGGPNAEYPLRSTDLTLYAGRVAAVHGKRVTIQTFGGRHIVLDLPFFDSVVDPGSKADDTLHVGDSVQVRAVRDDTALVFGERDVMGVIVLLRPDGSPGKY